MRNTFLTSEKLIIVWCQDNFFLFLFFINFFNEETVMAVYTTQ